MSRYGNLDRLRRARRAPSWSRRSSSRTTTPTSSRSSACTSSRSLGLDILTGFTGQISLGHGAFMGIGAYTTTILVVDHGWRDLWTIPLGGRRRRRDRARLRAARDAVRRPVPRARNVRHPALVHRDHQALPALHRRQRRQEPAAAALRARLARQPVDLVLRRLLGRGARHVPARVPRSCAGASGGRCGPCATARSPRRRTACRPRTIKTAAFGISAFYCGVAGSLYAIGITYVNPDTFPIDLSILLLVGIVLGGAGSLYGMLFGALFVEFIRISWGPAHPRSVQQGASRRHPRSGIRPRRLRRRPPPRALRRSGRRSRARPPTYGTRRPSQGQERHFSFGSRPRIVGPGSPPRSLRKRRQTHEEDVPADRRSSRRFGRRRRDGRRGAVGDAGRDSEVDPARGDVPPQRAGFGLRPDPRRHGRVLLVRQRPRRRQRTQDQLALRGRRVQPRQHGAVDAQVRRAGSRVRPRRRARAPSRRPRCGST